MEFIFSVLCGLIVLGVAIPICVLIIACVCIPIIIAMSWIMGFIVLLFSK